MRKQINKFKRRVITARYRLFGADEVKLSVDGLSARFPVESHAERWRATEAMGEREILKTFLQAIDGDSVVWDIGAAVGTYAILAAQRASHVVAFEPDPTNADRLRETADLNGLNNVTIQELALSASDGTSHLQRSGSEVGSGANQLGADGIEVRTARGETVPGPDPDVVKIDVEGHEMDVLDGMGDRLNEVETVIVEVHGAPDPVAERLESAGLTVETVANKRSETYLRGSRVE